MYLNESTMDQKIRVGKGPMRNFIWDLNTMLQLEPFFLTKMANFIPFVNTRAPSTLTFEGEIAQIIPNPNTRNNDQTGDHDGVAYIDDFEASKRETPLQIIRSGWSYASPPKGKYDYEERDLSNRGRLYYWNPYEQYPIQYIKPNKDLNANVAQRTNILKMEFHPSETAEAPDSSWNGIQKALSSGMANQTETKFIEVWIKNMPSTTANLHIEMGQISEDIIPNREFDTEDQLVNGIRNGLLDDGEDIGLDGMSDDSPIAQQAGGDFWDLNQNGVKDPGEPYSYDNWSYEPQGRDLGKTPKQANGTENNQNDAKGRYPDTEDMNANGDLDLRNDYFSYKINLNHNSQDYRDFVSGASIDKETNEDFGWRLYRIPIDVAAPRRTKVGSPDISLIEYIRIWVDGFNSTDPQQIWIAEMNLVGSRWKEQGVAQPMDPLNYDVEADSIVTVSVINTEDNPEYQPPAGVEGEVDRITKARAKEQALVLNVNGLQPGYNGKIQKIFPSGQDYINYSTLKMFVYGEDTTARHITKDSSQVEFFFRFGYDEENYYEVRRPVYQGWNKNDIEVDLIELSQIKVTGTIVDTTGGVNVFVKERGGEQWIVYGEPALRNIQMLEAGVINNHEYLPFSGKIYLNELRLSNVKKEKGVAMRASVNFSWADLLTFNGQMNKQDAEFHNVGQRFGNGNNEFSGNFSSTIQTGKFLPAKLGVKMPVTVTYSRSESTPKYLPNEDIEVTDSLPDSTLEAIRNLSESKGLSVSFGIDSRSQNFFVKNIISPFNISYSRNEGESSSSTIKYNRKKSEQGNISWRLNFGPDNYVFPLKFLENIPLLVKLSDMKLYYTPQSISTKVSGNRNFNESLKRSGLQSSNSSFTIRRDFSTNLKVIDALSVNYSRNYVNDLRDVPGDSLWDEIQTLQLGVLSNVNQNSSISFKPKLFSWFNTNISYSVSFQYAYNRQQKTSARNTTQNRSFKGNGSLDFSTLFKSVGRPKPQNRGRSGRGGDEKAGSGSSFSILGSLTKVFNIFDPISYNYNRDQNVSIYGLAGIPTIPFQFGLTRDIGVEREIDENSVGTTSSSGSESERESFGLKSGLRFTRNIRMNFGYDTNYNFNKSTQTTGQRSKSWLVWQDDFSEPFPTWSIKVGGLEKLPFIKDYVTRFSIDHSRSGRASETFTLEEGVEKVTQETKDTQFRPFVGVNLTMKNGISVNISYNKSTKQQISMVSGSSGTLTESEDLSITADYSKRGNFKLPFTLFGKRRLKNAVDISLRFTFGNTATMQNRGQGYEVTSETGKWLLRPQVNYSFSSRVNGGLYFEMGKNHNKQIGDTSYKELGINVSIAIRGN
ncbi:MAG: cell surface protein SprA [candidate division KSB1 bacterium]|nr:cell surface protein SprA [candidate division KSB1 bacterium]